MNVISELDHPLITEEWTRLTTHKGRRSFALRLRKPWIDEATGASRQKWILCSCGRLMFILQYILFYIIFVGVENLGAASRETEAFFPPILGARRASCFRLH